MLIAALNGSWPSGAHPALPLDPAALAADAAACAAAGVTEVHVHPRDASGRESLDADVVDSTVLAIRQTISLPVSVTTGGWIEPSPAARVAAVRRWRRPDSASVNLSEDGAGEVMAALADAGIAIEAGIWTPSDVHKLVSTGFAGRVSRVLVEIVHSTDDPVGEARRIHTALDRARVHAARLVHGEGDSCWPVLAAAKAEGWALRIGLEDTLTLPEGAPASSNRQLVETALTLPASGHEVSAAERKPRGSAASGP